MITTNYFLTISTHRLLTTLPETASSPWAQSFAESWRSSSRCSLSSPRAPGPALSEGLAHSAEPLRREHSALVLGEGLRWRRHPNNRNIRLRPSNSPRVRHPWLSAKKYPRRKEHLRREHCLFGECISSAHGEFFKKNLTFSSSNFFLAPHTLIQCTCSKLTPFCLCLLYLTISLLYMYFFLIRPIWTASA
jgi:hypothetical protein